MSDAHVTDKDGVFPLGLKYANRLFAFFVRDFVAIRCKRYSA